ncbi:MAG: hypothetical protein QM778_31475 [Myxococcales bacterium]
MGATASKTTSNWAYFSLEGAPYFVRSVRVSGGQAELLLSNDREVTLDVHSLREGPDAALYCTVLGGEPARFDSHAAVQLGDLLEEDAEGPYVRQGSVRVHPPRVADPLHFSPRTS